MGDKNRREILTGGGVLPGLATNPWGEDCRPPGRGPKGAYFPNVVVTTHEGERARFYDDLLANKTVMIHCMTLTGEAERPETSNLLEVQRILGDRVGKDVFLYSMTLDPKNDTAHALRDYARDLGVRPGWRFLTGDPDDIESLRHHLYLSTAHRHGADCSRGLLRYGNEEVGIWGSVPTRIDPRWIAQRISWVAPRQLPTGPSRRRGPSIMPWTAT